MTGTDVMEDAHGQRGRGRSRRCRRLWLSALSWLLILCGLTLIATPLLQRAYSKMVQAQLRAAMEREVITGAAVVTEGLVGLADRAFDAIDPVFNRTEEDPTLAAPEGIPGLSTRQTPAGASRIIIEKAEVDAIVVDGTSVRHLRRGPGFYPEGSLPDLGGNVAIAGHRTTYGGWFRHLDRVEPGDIIRLEYKGSIYTYKVEWVRVIAHNDWSVIAPTGEHVLTLTTCHPPGSSAYRLAVRARWIGTSKPPRSHIR